MSEFTPNRRTLVLSGAAALAAFGLAARGDTAARVIQSGGGIAGGGSVQTDTEGPGEFSVFGSQFVAEDSDTPIFVGSLSYLDVLANMTVDKHVHHRIRPTGRRRGDDTADDRLRDRER